MRSSVRVGLAAVVGLLALSSVAPVSAGSGTSTRWVDDDGHAGPTSCGGRRTATRSIQTAVNRSDRNDVVIVCPGSYSGKVLIKGSSRNGMKVRAASTGTAILRAPSSHREGPLVMVQEVSNVLVRGLALQFSATGCLTRSDVVTGIWVTDANGTDIVANQMRTTGSATQGRCGFDDGIRVRYSTGVLIDANTVRDFKRNGISFEKGSRGRIEDNKVYFYHSLSTSNNDGNQGIRLVSDSQADVLRNEVKSRSGSEHPKLEIGIRLAATSGVTNIRDNLVRFTKTGIGVRDSATRIESNVVGGTGLENGIHAWSLSGTGTSSEIIDNRVYNHQTGISVDIDGTTITGNNATGNIARACRDTTSGGGTAGTANTWTGNTGSPASNPVDICPVP